MQHLILTLLILNSVALHTSSSGAIKWIEDKITELEQNLATAVTLKMRAVHNKAILLRRQVLLADHIRQAERKAEGLTMEVHEIELQLGLQRLVLAAKIKTDAALQTEQKS